MPRLISASAQTISTPTENHLLLRLHREIRSLASSDAISSYFLSTSMYTFHIYCSFSNKPSIQTWLWLPVALLAIPDGEKFKTLHRWLLKIVSEIAIFLHRKGKFMSLCHFSTQEREALVIVPFFYTGKGSSCHCAIFLHRKGKFMSFNFKGEMNAQFSDIANYFDVTEMHVSLWEWPTAHTTCKHVSRCLHMLHTNAYPGIKRPYSRMHMPSNMG